MKLATNIFYTVKLTPSPPCVSIKIFPFEGNVYAFPPTVMFVPGSFPETLNVKSEAGFEAEASPPFIPGVPFVPLPP